MLRHPFYIYISLALWTTFHLQIAFPIPSCQHTGNVIKDACRLHRMLHLYWHHAIMQLLTLGLPSDVSFGRCATAVLETTSSRLDSAA